MAQSKTEIKNNKMSLGTCSLRKSGYTFVYVQVYPMKDVSSHVNNEFAQVEWFQLPGIRVTRLLISTTQTNNNVIYCHAIND